MDPIFKKMNFKGQPEVVVLNAPESFKSNMAAMAGLTRFQTDLDSPISITCFVAFVTQQKQINEIAPLMNEKLEGDALVWFCYPKKSSKNYACDFSRDTGWEILGELGFEGVRMVAVDADWSALRFRKVSYIKKFTRREGFAISKEGKSRTTNKGK